MCIICNTTGSLSWTGVPSGIRSFDNPSIMQVTATSPITIEGKRSEGGGGLLVVFGNEIVGERFIY